MKAKHNIHSIMPSSTTSSSPSPSLSSLTKGGDWRVSKLRQDWVVHEDHALAERLQNREIELHYEGNRRRNIQIREDFPKALEEQTAEVRGSNKVREEEEQRNMIMARRMAEELSNHDREQDIYEETRDQIFARKIHALELRKNNKQEEKNFMALADAIDRTSQKTIKDNAKRNTSSTPPLPILPNLEVTIPSEEAWSGMEDVELQSASAQTSQAHSDISFHDLKGGIRYNDHQYMVKTAVPATVVDNEPVYANNRPEHYAVSKPFPASAIGVAEATNAYTSSELLNATGLSQRDLVLSKRAELQLEQERRDKELAERLQIQMQSEECSGLSTEAAEILKRKVEADDHQLAKALYAKEKAKLKRAKERSRMKKQYKNKVHDLDSQPRSLSDPKDSGWQKYCEIPSELPDSDCQFPHTNNANGAIPKTKESSVSPPARKPYLNRGLIDVVNGPLTMTATCSSKTLTEPQYENLTSDCGSAKCTASDPEQTPTAAVSRLDSEIQTVPVSTKMDFIPPAHEDGDTPVPPYMPMQRSNKTSIMEKKINRCKEKEGCNQQ